MIELTKEKLITVIVAGIVIVLLGLYAFLYRPLINRCRQTGLECRDIEREALRAHEAIGLLKQSITKRTLISEEDISLAIDELTKKGRAKGINFTSIAPGKIQKSGDFRYKILPIDMQMESTYKELAMFLGSLEELEKSLVTVKDLNIASDRERSAELNTRLTVNMCLSDR